MSDPTIATAADAVENAFLSQRAWAERAQLAADKGKPRADLPQVLSQLPGLEHGARLLRWLERNEQAIRQAFGVRA